MSAAAITTAGIKSGLIGTNGYSADKRICLAFGPDFGRRSVTGQNGHVVAERKKFLPDSAK